MNGKISRRDFLKTTAVSAVGIAAMGALGACGNSTAAPTETVSPETSAPVAEWDYEADIVIVGAGTGLLGAMIATDNDASVVVLEKSGILGGTSIMSGGYFWVPGNSTFTDDSDEEILEYVRGADAFDLTTDEMRMDYIKNARKMAEYVDGRWGYVLVSSAELPIASAASDYYNLDYAQFGGERSLIFVDAETKTYGGAAGYFSGMIVPTLKEREATLLTDTSATALIQDETGRVIGVRAATADGEIRVKGGKGVVLSCGSFDHNEAMRKAYLKFPLVGSYAVSTNTGDGIRMGQKIGADLGCMNATLGGNGYLVNPGDFSFNAGNVYDFYNYRGLPHTMMVNSKGKRFVNESCAYPLMIDMFSNYDATASKLANLPAYLIFDKRVVETCGYWPGYGADQPEWVLSFETLEDLAEHYGINAENLVAEVEKFNGFVDAGADEDFHRGEFGFEQRVISQVFGDIPVLGKIEPPYYVCETGPSSLGTKGGLKVNTDAQVIDVDGNVIEGLYSAGTCAAAILGNCYGGGGGGLGPGFYQNFRAVNHILDLNLV